MQIKIASGLVVDVQVGDKIIRLDSFKVSPEEGPLEVKGFEGVACLVELEPGVLSSVSGDTIAEIVKEAEELVDVKLPDGTIIKAPKSVAPLLQAVFDANKALVEQIASIVAGTELEAVKRERDELKALVLLLQADRDKVLAVLPAVRDQLVALCGALRI